MYVLLQPWMGLTANCYMVALSFLTISFLAMRSPRPVTLHIHMALPLAFDRAAVFFRHAGRAKSQALMACSQLSHAHYAHGPRGGPYRVPAVTLGATTQSRVCACSTSHTFASHSYLPEASRDVHALTVPTCAQHGLDGRSGRFAAHVLPLQRLQASARSPLLTMRSLHHEDGSPVSLPAATTAHAGTVSGTAATRAGRGAGGWRWGCTRRCRSTSLAPDHRSCPWVNNCVGANNQKHFVLFVGYTGAQFHPGCFLACPIICPIILFVPANPLTTHHHLSTITYPLLPIHYYLSTITYPPSPTHQHPPLTAHHSPLTTHHSPPITHRSPLTTHHSPLTTHHPSPITHHPPLTTHHPPPTIPSPHHPTLTTHHSPLTIHRPPLTTHTYHMPTTTHHSSPCSSRHHSPAAPPPMHPFCPRTIHPFSALLSPSQPFSALRSSSLAPAPPLLSPVVELCYRTSRRPYDFQRKRDTARRS